MRWAQPDVDHASELMRTAFDDRAATTERSAAAGRRLREAHALSSVGRLAHDRLRALM
jgi:hypothetical protein